MNWTPLYPNIPLRSSWLDISYKGETMTVQLDPRIKFTYIEARNNTQRDDVFADFSEEINRQLRDEGAPFNDIRFGYNFRLERMVVYRKDADGGPETVTISKPTQNSMLQRMGGGQRDNLDLVVEPQESIINPEEDERINLIRVRKSTALPEPPRLSRTEFIYLASNLARGDSAVNEVTLSTNSIIKSIPITNPSYGSLPTYTATGAINLSHLRGIANNLRTAQIDILDDELQPLELTDQSHMNMEIYVTYKTAQGEEPQRPKSVPLKVGGKMAV